MWSDQRRLEFRDGTSSKTVAKFGANKDQTPESAQASQYCDHNDVYDLLACVPPPDAMSGARRCRCVEVTSASSTTRKRLHADDASRDHYPESPAAKPNVILIVGLRRAPVKLPSQTVSAPVERSTMHAKPASAPATRMLRAG